MFEKFNIFKRLNDLEEETEKIKRENDKIISEFKENFSKFISIVGVVEKQNLSQRETIKTLKYMNEKMESGMLILRKSNVAMGSLDLKSDLNVS